MSFDRRAITDPRAIRGMAHPLRLEILELLQTRGPMTATDLSELLGESPASCSFHLRTLAKYGFILEAPSGKGRSRPWRAADYEWSVAEETLTGDAKRAAPKLGAMIREQAFRRMERWIAERGSFPAKWRKSAFDHQVGVSLTAEEMAALGAAFKKLLEPYLERDESPAGALSSSVLCWGFPNENAEQRRERKAAR